MEKTVQIYDTTTEEHIVVNLDDHPVALEGNIHGGVFAWASKGGTQMFLHKVDDGTLFMTLNRGKSHAEITSISFDKYCFRMAVCSTKDTVHVYALPKELALKDKTVEELKDSTFSNENSLPANLLESRYNTRAGLLSKFMYGDGEWSYLKIYVPHPSKICAIEGNNLYILQDDGIMHTIDVQCEGSYYTNSKEVKTELVC